MSHLHGWKKGLKKVGGFNILFLLMFFDQICGCVMLILNAHACCVCPQNVFFLCQKNIKNDYIYQHCRGLCNFQSITTNKYLMTDNGFKYEDSNNKNVIYLHTLTFKLGKPHIIFPYNDQHLSIYWATAWLIHYVSLYHQVIIYQLIKW